MHALTQPSLFLHIHNLPPSCSQQKNVYLAAAILQCCDTPMCHLFDMREQVLSILLQKKGYRLAFFLHQENQCLYHRGK
jgi:hypothetical protein